MQSMKGTWLCVIEVVPSSKLDSMHEIGKVKVLLGYFVCSVANVNTPNVVEFIKTYTTMCRKYGRTPGKSYSWAG